MGRRKRKRFTVQQKAQAVGLVRASGRGVTQVARDLDLTPSALARWVEQAGLDTKKAPGESLTNDERKKLAQLRRDHKLLEQKNAFLKKAIAAGRCRVD